MKQLQSFFNNNKWAILSGILIGTSYLPFPPWALGFGYLPLWLDFYFHPTTAKQAFKKAWVTQFVLSVIGFYWIFIVSKEYGYLPSIVAGLLLILFASTMHIYIAVAHYLGFTLIKSTRMDSLDSKIKLPTILLMTIGLINFFEKYWPTIFPWNLGYPLMAIRVFPIYQTAEWIGFLGLSFLVLLSNWFLFMAIIKAPPQKANLKQSLLFIIFWFLMVIPLGVAGFFLQKNIQYKEESALTKTFNSLVVQANVGNLEKAFAEKGKGFMQDITNKYFSLTQMGLAENKNQNSAPIDLVIWPESAFPDFLNQNSWLRKFSSQLKVFLNQTGITLLTGGYSRVENKEYNALFLLKSPSTLPTPLNLDIPEQLGLYHKTNLLIFGEYIPGLKYFPALAKYNPAGEGFSAGTGPQVLSFLDWKLGVQICYESLYPEFSAELVKNGAQILINVTNDSWFSQNHGPTFFRTSSEAYQHMYMTLARAIEMRRPLIRSTNTGITTAITASGQIQATGPTQQEWQHQFQLPVITQQPPLTIYAQYENFFSWWPLLFTVFIFVVARNKKPKIKVG